MIHRVISPAFLIPAGSGTISAAAGSSALNDQCANSVTAEIRISKLPKV